MTMLYVWIIFEIMSVWYSIEQPWLFHRGTAGFTDTGLSLTQVSRLECGVDEAQRADIR